MIGCQREIVRGETSETQVLRLSYSNPSRPVGWLRFHQFGYLLVLEMAFPPGWFCQDCSRLDLEEVVPVCQYRVGSNRRGPNEPILPGFRGTYFYVLRITVCNNMCVLRSERMAPLLHDITPCIPDRVWNGLACMWLSLSWLTERASVRSISICIWY